MLVGDPNPGGHAKVGTSRVRPIVCSSTITEEEHKRLAPAKIQHDDRYTLY